MSRGKRGAGKRAGEQQYSIAAKVTPDEKKAIDGLIQRYGCTTSELVREAVLGRVAVAPPIVQSARDHLATAHALLAAVHEGKIIDGDAINELIEVTKQLIGEARRAPS